jgi:hypothetical protein
LEADTATRFGERLTSYAIANWDRLTRFVENVLVPLDNNGTERAIRGPVVGRKNHYGSKSRRGTEVAAVFYTLVGTAAAPRGPRALSYRGGPLR